MGGERKAFLSLAGEPLLLHALRPFLASSAIDLAVVALAAADAATPPAWLAALDPRVRVVEGGAERGDSVARALAVIPETVDVVVVHDAARPLVGSAIIERVIAAAARGHSVIAAVPLTDTVQEVDEHGTIVATPDRRRLWRAQTPQAFPRAVLVEAYVRAGADGATATDDAALVTRYGGRVRVVEDDPGNLKVTTAVDMIVAESLLGRRR
jgi:2-C-methyl-D-erythritol 4-phosphate cytidylyltransferase